MSIDLSKFHAIFFDESREHLEEMERLLLAIDMQSPDPDDLNAIFRAAHSVKGGSATFGFSDMAAVTHELESLLDQVRNHEIPLTNAIIDAALLAGDVLNQQLQGHRDGFEVDPAIAQPVIEQIRGLSEADKPAQTPAELTDKYHWQLVLSPQALSADLIANLRAELERLGQLTVIPRNDGSSEFGLRNCSMNENAFRDMMTFVVGTEAYELLPLEEVPGADHPPENEGFGFFVDLDTLKPSTPDTQDFGFFVDIPAPAPDTNPQTPTSKQVQAADTAAPAHHRQTDREGDSSIRVSVEKVDQLINLVGELVITHAMLAQTVSRLDPMQNENLFDGMGQLERNSRDLQEAVMSIRMLPISFVFSRFPRMVRDLAGKFDKQVELKLVGEHTELDKGLIEKLADPLTHLVRNSLDHGIETVEQRLAAGKPAKGILTLQAFHQGGNIVIEVSDDGAGLNRTRIMAKAHERGIELAEDAPDHEVWQLIFAPGFSTAEKVTDVSGRGVGMDVVKRNIEGMGGRIEISTTPGQGTRISIRLPLTLAILDGMSVGVGGQTFILPLGMIIESLQPRDDEISTISSQGRVVHVRGEYLPLVALHEIFNIEPHTTDPCAGILVILEVDGGKAALFVDELLGQHQVVIKSLETNYRRVRGVSGATIMGDGRVALILDVASLIQLSRGF